MRRNRNGVGLNELLGRRPKESELKINKLQPGAVVYDVQSQRMGNTTLRSVGVWPVQIVSVDVEAGTVMAKWNGNPERKFREHQWSKWRAEKPTLVKTGLGAYRLAKRDEVAP